MGLDRTLLIAGDSKRNLRTVIEDLKPDPSIVAKAELLLAAGLRDHECWELLEEMTMGEVETIIKLKHIKKGDKNVICH